MTPVNFREARSIDAPSPIARMLPVPRRRERAHVDLAAPAAAVWQIIRHGNLVRTPLLRLLFRGGARWTGLAVPSSTSRFSIDELSSTPEHPGLRLFSDEPPLQFTVGALARSRRGGFELLHATSIEEFGAFNARGFVKVAWAAAVVPLGMGQSRLHLELRLDADGEAWRSLRWSYACVKPVLNWAHRQLLGSLADELGWPSRIGPQPAPAGGFTLTNP